MLCLRDAGAFSPCHFGMAWMKNERTKSNSRQNADQYFPADCKMRQSKKLSNFPKPEQQQSKARRISRISGFHISPFDTKPDRQFPAQSGFFNHVFQAKILHKTFLPFSGDNASIVLSCHPAPELLLGAGAAVTAGACGHCRCGRFVIA